MRRRVRAALVDHLDYEHAGAEFGSELDLIARSRAGMENRVRRQLTRDQQSVIEHGRDLTDLFECLGEREGGV